MKKIILATAALFFATSLCFGAVRTGIPVQNLTLNYLSVGFSNANTIYVSESGDNSSALRGHPDKAWNSISQAFSQLQSGDTLLIGPGTFPVDVVTMQGGGQTIPNLNGQDRDDPGLAPLEIIGKSNIVVQGSGPATIIQADDVGHVISLESCTNIVFRDFTIQGVRTNETSILESETYFALITLRKMNSLLTFDHLVLKDSDGHGISQLWDNKFTYGARITDCDFWRIGSSNHPTQVRDGSCISGIGPDWTIQGCNFYDSLRGVEIESLSYATPEIDNVRVSNCGFYGIKNVAFMVWPAKASTGNNNVRNVWFTDNVVSNMPPPDSTKIASVNAISIWGGDGIHITDNVFADLSKPSGANGYVLSTGNADCQNVNGLYFIGNVMRNVDRPIYIDQVGSAVNSNIWVMDNLVSGPSSAAVTFTVEGSHMVLDGNQILGQSYGIYVTGGYDIRLTNNRFTRNGASMYSGINIYAGVTHCRHQHNFFDPGTSWVTAKWIDASAATGLPCIESGAGAPPTPSGNNHAIPNGSLWLRSDGTGPNLYVMQNGTWTSK